jgi:hypothetical protein
VKLQVKVFWNMLCAPKQEGGLGIKKLVDWNRCHEEAHMELVCQIGLSLGSLCDNLDLITSLR